MSEVLFYHLTESKLENTLPDLIARSLQRNWRVAVLCRNITKAKEIDNLLWTFSEDAFLPHALESEEFPEYQPILIGINDQNMNDAHVCFCLDGRITKEIDNYKRVCLMFDSHNDEYLNDARTTWKSLKAKNSRDNYQLTYWQQTPQRKWEKKA